MRQVSREPHVFRPDPRLFACSHVHSSRYFHCEVLITSSLYAGPISPFPLPFKSSMPAGRSRAVMLPKAPRHFTGKATFTVLFSASDPRKIWALLWRS